MAEVKKLGELLKDAGLIDDFQLETALSHQRNWGGKLGAVLVELGFAREEDVAKIIAEKLKIPYANLFEPEIPEAVIKLIKEDVAKKYVVMPVKKESGSLVVAMSDPLDIGVIDVLRFITGLNIKPALALDSEIKLAVRKYYGHELVVRRTLTSFKETASSSSGKMEIIRGSDLNMPKAEQGDPSSAVLSREETAQQSSQDGKVRLDALISLLIEKGLITREELVSMVYQKKLGL
jgi:hypothetical protein